MTVKVKIHYKENHGEVHTALKVEKLIKIVFAVPRLVEIEMIPERVK